MAKISLLLAFFAARRDQSGTTTDIMATRIGKAVVPNKGLILTVTYINNRFTLANYQLEMKIA